MLPQPNSTPGVSVFLIHGGKFLLQLRDNIPTISNPNKWGVVGGAIEEGEIPEVAIKRECMEEIAIVPSGLTYIGHTQDNKYRFYAYLSDEEVKNLVLGEGQAIKFFSPDEVSTISLSPRVEQFFIKYLNAVQKFIKREEIIPQDLGLEK